MSRFFARLENIIKIFKNVVKVKSHISNLKSYLYNIFTANIPNADNILIATYADDTVILSEHSDNSVVSSQSPIASYKNIKMGIQLEN